MMIRLIILFVVFFFSCNQKEIGFRRTVLQADERLEKSANPSLEDSTYSAQVLKNTKRLDDINSILENENTVHFSICSKVHNYTYKFYSCMNYGLNDWTIYAVSMTGNNYSEKLNLLALDHLLNNFNKEIKEAQEGESSMQVLTDLDQDYYLDLNKEFVGNSEEVDYTHALDCKVLINLQIREGDDPKTERTKVKKVFQVRRVFHDDKYIYIKLRGESNDHRVKKNYVYLRNKLCSNPANNLKAVNHLNMLESKLKISSFFKRLIQC